MLQADPATSSGPRVVIIGAGFGGLGMVRALRQAGVDDVVVLERAEGVGGVWRENTYPGAACDVPSPLYSWSWAVNPAWGRRYAPQPEILDYLTSAAEREGLTDAVRFGQQVTACRYDDDTATWTVETAAGHSYRADAVITAVGQLSNPVVPDLPGIESFEGPVFHSAHWRHDVDLRGHRVAVVGTGASAIQFVPGIVDAVGTLTVFQRSAPYVVPKPDVEFTARRSRAFDRFPRLLDGERRGWFWVSEKLNAALEGRAVWSGALLAAVRAAWKLHLRRQVPDADLRARLEPGYEIGCKRILFSNDWYPALARPHVEVVTQPVTAVEPHAVLTADGGRHEVDVLIWGTGFAATSFLDGIEVTGTDGTDLHRTWADGARAYLGLMAPGFPNLFFVYGPNTNLGGSSIIGMMEAQAIWIAEAVARLGAGRRLDVAAASAETYDREMQTRLGDSAWATCQSWYRDHGRITTNWPGKVGEYQERTATVDWSHLELTDR